MGGSAPADIVNQRRIDQLTEEHLAKSALDNESPIQGGLNLGCALLLAAASSSFAVIGSQASRSWCRPTDCDTKEMRTIN
jgi:hypothetical protein